MLIALAQAAFWLLVLAFWVRDWRRWQKRKSKKNP